MPFKVVGLREAKGRKKEYLSEGNSQLKFKGIKAFVS